MDKSLLELENELKRLRPRTPSAKLLRRIEAGLAGSGAQPGFSRATASPRPTLWPWLNGRTVAAAAAVVVFAAVVLSSWRPVRIENNAAAPDAIAPTQVAMPVILADSSEIIAAVPAPVIDRYQPVGAASVLYDLKEDRVVTMPSSTPARRLRYRYVDTYTWKNPATNASLKWSLPRDEVRVVPASLH